MGRNSLKQHEELCSECGIKKLCLEFKKERDDLYVELDEKEKLLKEFVEIIEGLTSFIPALCELTKVKKAMKKAKQVLKKRI